MLALWRQVVSDTCVNIAWSGNGLSNFKRQAITRTDVDLLSVRPQGIYNSMKFYLKCKRFLSGIRLSESLTKPPLKPHRWVLHPTVWRGCTYLSFGNTLRPRQNVRHFSDDIKCISLNENFLILNKISMKYVHKGLIDNIATLVQIIVWRRTGDKPLSEAMLVCCADAYMRHSTSIS